MNKHIVKSYDRDLDLLTSKIAAMGKAAGRQLENAMDFIRRDDPFLAGKIIEKDSFVNILQAEVDALTVKILASRQPMAGDLRYVIAAQKIAAELERIADYAVNIVKNFQQRCGDAFKDSVQDVLRMASLGGEMLTGVIAAYIDADAEKAVDIWRRDDDIDRIYDAFIRKVRQAMKVDACNVDVCTTLLFAGRCCERIGDHVTNISENIYYMVTGESLHLLKKDH
jgi:phosphate transport system protein